MKESIFSAGAGKGDISFPEEMLPTPEGYNKIHDVPHARVVLMQAGRDRYALVHLELNNVFETGTTRILRAVSEELGLDPNHIWFHCLHVLETPHPAPPGDHSPEGTRFNDLFFSAVEKAARQAARKAFDSLQPARVGSGFARCATCNTNRNILTDQGWWLGSGEDGPCDKDVAVIRLEALDSSPIAVLFIYNSQSSIMDGSRGRDGSRYITADLAGSSAAFVEEQLPGCIAMYCTGAGGDGCPSFQAKRTVLGAAGKSWTVDLHETGFLLVELLGERLGSVVVQCAEKLSCQDIDSLSAVIGSIDFEGRPRFPLDQLRPCRSFDFRCDGSVKTMEPVIFRIGRDIALVGVYAEICAKTEMEIKQRSTTPFTAVTTFTQMGYHGGTGMGKYMGERDMYERVTFQAMNSGVCAGSAERLCDYVTTLLNNR